MTAPSPADAGLRDALALASINLLRRHTGNSQFETLDGARRVYREDMQKRWLEHELARADALIAGPLAEVLTALATETRARAELGRERDEARETWTDEHGTTWSPPTAWAYAQACRVMHGSKARLAAAEAENEVLRVALGECGEAIDFFDHVRMASEVERIAVGQDHFKWLEQACRRARAALAASPKEGSADASR